MTTGAVLGQRDAHRAGGRADGAGRAGTRHTVVASRVSESRPPFVESAPVATGTGQHLHPERAPDRQAEE